MHALPPQPGPLVEAAVGPRGSLTTASRLRIAPCGGERPGESSSCTRSCRGRRSKRRARAGTRWLNRPTRASPVTTTRSRPAVPTAGSSALRSSAARRTPPHAQPSSQAAQRTIATRRTDDGASRHAAASTSRSSGRARAGAAPGARPRPRQARRPQPPIPARRGAPASRDDQPLELREPRRADARDRIETLDGRERPMLLRGRRRSSAAVTGPIPGSVSSCSTVAALSETGAPGADGPEPARSRRAGRAARRDDDLLPVGDARGQVDRAAVGATRETTRLRDGVGDACAVGEVVEPRFAHRTDHVDDDSGAPRAAERPAAGPGATRKRRRRGTAAVLAHQQHARPRARARVRRAGGAA